MEKAVNIDLLRLKERVGDVVERNKELTRNQFKTSDWTDDEYQIISSLTKASLRTISKAIDKTENKEELRKIYTTLKNNANSEVTKEVLKAINLFNAILGI